VLSLVGALAIGTVFSQLVFQNFSNSTWIFFGWLGLGVVSYVLYRRYRHEPLWEPLEVPPPPDREIDRTPLEPHPVEARLRMGRRERVLARAAAEPIHRRRRARRWVELELFFQQHGAVRGLLIVAVFAAVSGLAIGVDLSTYDPFGPQLQWSPGIVITALLAAYVLNRSRSER
jgi:hypothetical protein